MACSKRFAALVNTISRWCTLVDGISISFLAVCLLFASICSERQNNNYNTHTHTHNTQHNTHTVLTSACSAVQCSWKRGNKQ